MSQQWNAVFLLVLMICAVQLNVEGVPILKEEVPGGAVKQGVFSKDRLVFEIDLAGLEDNERDPVAGTSLGEQRVVKLVPETKLQSDCICSGDSSKKMDLSENVDRWQASLRAAHGNNQAPPTTTSSATIRQPSTATP